VGNSWKREIAEMCEKYDRAATEEKCDTTERADKAEK
jgi:hypothetical protein